jgi:hypothetical protein
LNGVLDFVLQLPFRPLVSLHHRFCALAFRPICINAFGRLITAILCFLMNFWGFVAPLSQLRGCNLRARFPLLCQNADSKVALPKLLLNQLHLSGRVLEVLQKEGGAHTDEVRETSGDDRRRKVVDGIERHDWVALHVRFGKHTGEARQHDVGESK